MNILFFIGNGFDINIGLNTSYKAFLEFYKSEPSNNENVEKLKKELNSNSLDWSDVEITFGKYTKQISSIEEFDEIYDDLTDKLSDFILDQEKNFNVSSLSKENFSKYLIFPEKTLSPADINSFNSFREPWSNSTWNTDIITFNYTRIIEKIIGEEKGKIQIGKHSNTGNVFLRSINHIHGFAESRLVFGVNDESQIHNSSFHDNPYILNDLIKSKCNQAIGHTIDDKCKNKVSRANLICIFGSSIGDTDNIWWKLIGQRLLENKTRLIIFNFDPIRIVENKRPQKKIRFEDQVRRKFLKKTDLSEEEKSKIEDKIFIGHNTNMFGELSSK